MRILLATLAAALTLAGCVDGGGDGETDSMDESSGGDGSSGAQIDYPQEDLGLADVYQGEVDPGGVVEIRYFGQDSISIDASVRIGTENVRVLGNAKISAAGGFESVAADPYSDIEVTITGTVGMDAGVGEVICHQSAFDGCTDGTWSALPSE